MNVRITNVTDGPDRSPQEVRIYNKRLKPGKHIDVPAHFVDDKVRALEVEGYIAIGPLPPWYSDYRRGRISANEINGRIASRKGYFDSRKAAAEAPPKKEVPKRTIGLKELPSHMRAPEELLDLSDAVPVEDEVSADERTEENKSGRKRKKR